MRLLAIEASTQTASCALWTAGSVIERRCAAERNSSETLLPAIMALLAEHQLGLTQLDGIAFGAGPGSFTGLRVAAGITQGLAFAAELPVAPVETLAAVAWADGSVDAKERDLILSRTEKAGIAPGTAVYELLRSWLDRKPESNLLAAWSEMVQGMREHMPPQEFESLRKEFIERAHKVARASGGVLGIGATSGAEQDAIARLEAAFRPRS